MSNNKQAGVMSGWSVSRPGPAPAPTRAAPAPAPARAAPAPSARESLCLAARAWWTPERLEQFARDAECSDRVLEVLRPRAALATLKDRLSLRTVSGALCGAGADVGAARRHLRVFRDMYHKQLQELAELALTREVAGGEAAGGEAAGGEDAAAAEAALGGAPQWLRRLEQRLNLLPEFMQELRRVSELGAPGPRDVGGVWGLAGRCAGGAGSAGFVRALSGAACARGARARRAPAADEDFEPLVVLLGAPADKLAAIWRRVCAVARHKLRLLLSAGDRAEAVPAHARLAPEDWPAANYVIMFDHEDFIVTEDSLVLYEQLQALTLMFHLAQAYELEPGPGPHAGPGPQRAAWARAHHAYTTGSVRGTVASAVLLQRRWHELKAQTRARVGALWRARGARGAAGAGGDGGKGKVLPIHQAIARRFPHVVTEPAASWRDLVRRGLVYDIQPEEAPAACAPPPPAHLPTHPPPPPPPQAPRHNNKAGDEDLILVERHIETIDLEHAASTAPAAPTPTPTPAAPTPTRVKSEPADAQREVLRARRQGMCAQLQLDLDQQLRDIARHAQPGARDTRRARGTRRSQDADVALMHNTSSMGAVSRSRADAGCASPPSSGQGLGVLNRLDPKHAEATIIFSDDDDDSVFDHSATSVGRQATDSAATVAGDLTDTIVASINATKVTPDDRPSVNSSDVTQSNSNVDLERNLTHKDANDSQLLVNNELPKAKDLSQYTNIDKHTNDLPIDNYNDNTPYPKEAARPVDKDLSHLNDDTSRDSVDSDALVIDDGERDDDFGFDDDDNDTDTHTHLNSGDKGDTALRLTTSGTNTQRLDVQDTRNETFAESINKSHVNISVITSIESYRDMINKPTEDVQGETNAQNLILDNIQGDINMATSIADGFQQNSIIDSVRINANVQESIIKDFKGGISEHNLIANVPKAQDSVTKDEVHAITDVESDSHRHDVKDDRNAPLLANGIQKDSTENDAVVGDIKDEGVDQSIADNYVDTKEDLITTDDAMSRQPNTNEDESKLNRIGAAGAIELTALKDELDDEMIQTIKTDVETESDGGEAMEIDTVELKLDNYSKLEQIGSVNVENPVGTDNIHSEPNVDKTSSRELNKTGSGNDENTSKIAESNNTKELSEVNVTAVKEIAGDEPNTLESNDLEPPTDTITPVIPSGLKETSAIEPEIAKVKSIAESESNELNIAEVIYKELYAMSLEQIETNDSRNESAAETGEPNVEASSKAGDVDASDPTAVEQDVAKAETGAGQPDASLDQHLLMERQLRLRAVVVACRVDSARAWRRHASPQGTILARHITHAHAHAHRSLASPCGPGPGPRGPGPGVRTARLLAACAPLSVRLHNLTPAQVHALSRPVGSRRARARSGRVSKPVELADIDEVRRINKNILTAQVKPIHTLYGEASGAPPSPGSLYAVRAGGGGGGDAGGEGEGSSDSESDSWSDGSGDASDDSYRPEGEGEGVRRKGDATKRTTGVAAGAGAGEAEPDGVAGAEAEAEDAMPSAAQLSRLLSSLASNSDSGAGAGRGRGAVPGSGAGAGAGAGAAGGGAAYCCSARRHRAVNDARRRMQARSGRPHYGLDRPIHTHPPDTCTCCCVHLLVPREAAAARLRHEQSALKRDLAQLLQHRVSPAHSPPPASEDTAPGDRKKRGPKRKQPADEDDDQVALADDYQEWVRQRNLTRKYFHIRPASAASAHKDKKAPATKAPAPKAPDTKAQAPKRTSIDHLFDASHSADSNVVKLCRRAPDTQDTSVANDSIPVPKKIPVSKKIPKKIVIMTKTPAQNLSLVEKQIPVQSKTPAQKQTSAQNHTSVQNTTSVQNQTPVQKKQPLTKISITIHSSAKAAKPSPAARAAPTRAPAAAKPRPGPKSRRGPGYTVLEDRPSIISMCVPRDQPEAPAPPAPAPAAPGPDSVEAPAPSEPAVSYQPILNIQFTTQPDDLGQTMVLGDQTLGQTMVLGDQTLGQPLISLAMLGQKPLTVNQFSDGQQILNVDQLNANQALLQSMNMNQTLLQSVNMNQGIFHSVNMNQPLLQPFGVSQLNQTAFTNQAILQSMNSNQTFQSLNMNQGFQTIDMNQPLIGSINMNQPIVQSMNMNQAMTQSVFMNQSVLQTMNQQVFQTVNQQVLQTVNQQVIQPMNQQMQTMSQQSQPINQNDQPMNQHTQSLLRQMQSMNQEPQSINEQINQQTQPMNQHTQSLLRQMQSMNQEPQSINEQINQQTQPMNQQPQSLLQQMQPMNQQIYQNHQPLNQTQPSSQSPVGGSPPCALVGGGEASRLPILTLSQSGELVLQVDPQDTAYTQPTEPPPIKTEAELTVKQEPTPDGVTSLPAPAPAPPPCVRQFISVRPQAGAPAQRPAAAAPKPRPVAAAPLRPRASAPGPQSAVPAGVQSAVSAVLQSAAALAARSPRSLLRPRTLPPPTPPQHPPPPPPQPEQSPPEQMPPLETEVFVLRPRVPGCDYFTDLSAQAGVRAEQLVRARDPSAVQLLRVDRARPLLRLTNNYLPLTAQDIPVSCAAYWTLAAEGRARPVLFRGEELDARSRMDSRSGTVSRGVVKVESFEALMSAGGGGGGGGGGPPDLVSAGGRLYKSLGVYAGITPTYAQVLTVVSDVSVCRRLIRCGASVWLYCVRSGRPTPLLRRDLASTGTSTSSTSTGTSAVGLHCDKDALPALRDLVARFNSLSEKPRRRFVMRLEPAAAARPSPAPNPPLQRIAPGPPPPPGPAPGPATHTQHGEEVIELDSDSD